MAHCVKIGVLNDVANSPASGPSSGIISPADMADWIEREIGALRQLGGALPEVEFVHAYGLGFPSGTAEAVENAYRQLADAQVNLIVGPAVDDNAVIAAALAEKLRIPTLNWSGAERARGRYMFQMQSGSPQEEARVIIDALKARKITRLAIAHDAAPHGARQAEELRREAVIAGIEAAHIAPVAGDVDEIGEMLSAMLTDTTPQMHAIAWLDAGQRSSAHCGAKAIRALGWAGTAIANRPPRDGAQCGGWLYLDLIAPGSDTGSGKPRSNSSLIELMSQPGLAGQEPRCAARGHDFGRIVALALARSTDVSREGLRLALENVRWVPSAQGEVGTLLGFGPYDRAALKGRYLVVRQMPIGGRDEEPEAIPQN